MKSKVCHDCLYVKTDSKGRTSRRCTKYGNCDIRYIEKCPMGYTESDIDWAEEIGRQDGRRQHPLYALM